MTRLFAAVAIALMFIVPPAKADAGGCQFNSFSQFQQFPQMQSFAYPVQQQAFAYAQPQFAFQAQVQAPQVFVQARAPVVRQQVIRQNIIQQRRPIIIRERRGLFGLRRRTTIIR